MKTILLILSILTSSLLLQGQNSFSAKLNVPQEILQGEYGEITLDIYKPEGTRNYTVFTQVLPVGFYVNMIDVKGAAHSYENNTLTLTWMRCPAESKITVKYQIASMVGVTGRFNLSGKLTYMAGSKQGVFNIKPIDLNVVKKKTVVSNIENTNSNVQINPVINTKLKGVSCSRAITYNKKKNLYEVELILKKSKTGSYSITEKIPKNFIFSETDSQDARIKHQSGLVQFLWINLPKERDIKLKYNLTPKENITETPSIFGKLSFLKNGKILNHTITNKG